MKKGFEANFFGGRMPFLSPTSRKHSLDLIFSQMHFQL